MSFNNCADERFIDIHCAYLTACERSRNCKRFIASEYAGNIDDFPLHPRIYGTTRAPFRKVLQESTDIEWTLFNNGWFMDYFLPKDKTYMRPVPDEFPVDPNAWQACIKGTGDEPQSWTCCRDVGKAVVMLLHAPEWVGSDTNPPFTPLHNAKASLRSAPHMLLASGVLSMRPSRSWKPFLVCDVLFWLFINHLH